jgi:hypothetical protein
MDNPAEWAKQGRDLVWEWKNEAHAFWYQSKGRQICSIPIDFRRIVITASSHQQHNQMTSTT